MKTNIPTIERTSLTRRSACLMPVLLATRTIVSAQQWVKLFDGKTLKGWTTHEHHNKIVVENGVIVGTVEYIPPRSDDEPSFGSTFLCYEKEYGDFVLELEIKTDPGVNSGIQFRSQIAGPDTHIMFTRHGKTSERLLPLDTVYGYQFEIEDGSPGRTGNIYDESRRGVLLDDSMKDRPGAGTAFKGNEWNTCRLECRGDRIRAWVNGIACADLHDSMRLRGIIGLQVHPIREQTNPPKQVRFRNIRIQEL